MQFLEVRHQHADVVKRVRSLRVAGDLRDLPRRQLGVNIFGERLALLREFADLGRNIDGGVVLDVTQLLDLGFEFCNRLLKIQERQFGGGACRHAWLLFRSGLWPRWPPPCCASVARLRRWRIASRLSANHTKLRRYNRRADSFSQTREALIKFSSKPD